VDDFVKRAAYFGCVQARPAFNTKEYATMHNATTEPMQFPATQTAMADLTDPFDLLRDGVTCPQFMYQGL